MRFKILEKGRRIVPILLVIAFVIGIFEGKGITFAYDAKSAMIYTNGSALAPTRKEPSDESENVRNFEYGKSVTIMDEVTDANGDLWYLISYILKSTGAQESSYCRAEYVKIDQPFGKGTLNDTEVSIRDFPGYEGTNALTYVNTGDVVELLFETVVEGDIWYRVRYQAPGTTDATTGEAVPGAVYVGWTREPYIDITEYYIDEAYKQQLIEAGFPESYTDKLAVLHARYPEWIFTPVQTGLKWQEVINGETLYADGHSKPINMVTKDSDDSMKPVHPDDYNWETNTWTIYDGDSWVAVHPDYLAYVMDPRNFFTEAQIFQFESLSYNEAHNIEGVNAVIGSSFMSKDVKDSDGSMFNYATAFMKLAQEVGVSPYHLVSRVRQEQGNKGTSSLISGTYKGYEGYYNYFNFGASGVTDKAVIENGLKYAKSQGWNTRYKSLKGGAERIAKNYIARGQDTLYFQKFNVVWADMLYGHQYMGAVIAPSSEAKSIAKAYTDKHQAFVFRIPVYEEMPETAVTFTPTGNPNNYLSKLVVEGLDLSPTFKGAVTDYTLTVDNAIGSINVSATPVVSKSTVTGGGLYNLEVGTNTIKILCESESGSERVYTLTVVRESNEEEPENPGDEPDTDEPSTDEPGSSEPTEPDTDEPGSSEPSEPTEPDTDEPGTSEPTEPSEPDTDEPSTEEPGTEEPSEPEVTYTFTDLNQTMYVISGVHIRDIPDKTGNSLGILSKDQEVKVTGQCNENEWYRIEYNGGVAYVSNKYLTITSPKPEVQPGISSEVYKIDKYITGIQPGTEVATFLNGITLVGNAEVKLLDKDGAEKTGIVGTGNVLAVYGNGQLIASYYIVIYGDVNGDGEIKMSDLLSINRHVIGTIKLKDVYLEAGDVNRKGDGATMSDLLAINRHVIGTILIVQ